MPLQIHTTFSVENWNEDPMAVATEIFQYVASRQYYVLRFQLGNEVYEYSFDGSLEPITGGTSYLQELRQLLRKLKDRQRNRRRKGDYLFPFAELVMTRDWVDNTLRHADLPKTLAEALEEAAGTPEDPIQYSGYWHSHPRELVNRAKANARRVVCFQVSESTYEYSLRERKVEVISGRGELRDDIESVVNAYAERN